MWDDYGDGLCCQWGIGNYTLVYQGMNGEEQEEEEVIATGAVFNESESTTFSIPYVATTELV